MPSHVRVPVRPKIPEPLIYANNHREAPEWPDFTDERASLGWLRNITGVSHPLPARLGSDLSHLEAQ